MSDVVWNKSPLSSSMSEKVKHLFSPPRAVTIPPGAEPVFLVSGRCVANQLKKRLSFNS